MENLRKWIGLRQSLLDNELFLDQSLKSWSLANLGSDPATWLNTLDNSIKKERNGTVMEPAREALAITLILLKHFKVKIR